MMPEAVKSLRLGKYKTASNTQVRVYLLGDTLIDTGPPNQWDGLKKFIEEHRPSQVILTHHHEDHAGNAAKISELTDARIYISGGAENPLAKGFSLRPYQRVVWGKPKNFSAKELPEEIFTSTGHRLLPIKTPGHSPDHTAFWEPDCKWLFSGDLYVGSKPRFLRKDEDLGMEMDTMRNLLKLDFEGLFCAHMGFFPDGRKRIEEKLLYLEDLVQKVQDFADLGLSVKQISDKIFKKERLLPLITLGHFSQKNMVLACLKTKVGRANI